jgi:protein-tyrosine-phosphatase
MVKKIKILFVCRYNRFRSRIAEAYFKKINQNKNISVKSAGLIQGSPVNLKEVSTLKKIGIDISGKPHGLTSKILAWQNVTIIVADDVPEQVFNKNKKYGKKVIVWKIKDTNSNKEKDLLKIAKIIINKVNSLKIEEL